MHNELNRAVLTLTVDVAGLAASAFISHFEYHGNVSAGLAILRLCLCSI
jgi:hypothetical protein